MKATHFPPRSRKPGISRRPGILSPWRHADFRSGLGSCRCWSWPQPADHPLRRLEHTVITPHLGYVVEDNYRAIYGQGAEDVHAFLDGEPIRVLNPEVLEKPAAG